MSGAGEALGGGGGVIHKRLVRKQERSERRANIRDRESRWKSKRREWITPGNNNLQLIFLPGKLFSRALRRGDIPAARKFRSGEFSRRSYCSRTVAARTLHRGCPKESSAAGLPVSDPEVSPIGHRQHPLDLHTLCLFNKIIRRNRNCRFPIVPLNIRRFRLRRYLLPRLA